MSLVDEMGLSLTLSPGRCIWSNTATRHRPPVRRHGIHQVASRHTWWGHASRIGRVSEIASLYPLCRKSDISTLQRNRSGTVIPAIGTGIGRSQILYGPQRKCRSAFCAIAALSGAPPLPARLSAAAPLGSPSRTRRLLATASASLVRFEIASRSCCATSVVIPAEGVTRARAGSTPAAPQSGRYRLSFLSPVLDSTTGGRAVSDSPKAAAGQSPSERLERPPQHVAPRQRDRGEDRTDREVLPERRGQPGTPAAAPVPRGVGTCRDPIEGRSRPR